MNKYERYEASRPKRRVVHYVRASYLEASGDIDYGAPIPLNDYSRVVGRYLDIALDILPGYESPAMLILEEVATYE